MTNNVPNLQKKAKKTNFYLLILIQIALNHPINRESTSYNAPCQLLTEHTDIGSNNS